MPRLPTMRVMGSQAMSTSWPSPLSPACAPGAGIVLVMGGAPVVGGCSPGGPCGCVEKRTCRHVDGPAGAEWRRRSPGADGSGGELAAGSTPARLLVDGAGGERAQRADDGAVGGDHRAGRLGARRL